MLEFEELRIRIWRIGSRKYLVFANGASTASAVITLKNEPAAYRKTFADLLEEDFGGHSSGSDVPLRDRLHQLGLAIYRDFFPESIVECIINCQNVAASKQRALRIRLDLAPELRDVPFEATSAPKDEPLGVLS